MIRRIHEFDAKDLERDPELSATLSLLDPASRDPNYWLRFRWWVMSGAAAELARRRREARLTVSDVLESWARALVPTFAVVAAIAFLVLLRGEPPIQAPPVGGQELLLSEVEGNAVPMEVSGLTFAAEIF
jgi:hypothetical protein